MSQQKNVSNWFFILFLILWYHLWILNLLDLVNHNWIYWKSRVYCLLMLSITVYNNVVEILLTIYQFTLFLQKFQFFFENSLIFLTKLWFMIFASNVLFQSLRLFFFTLHSQFTNKNSTTRTTILKNILQNFILLTNGS